MEYGETAGRTVQTRSDPRVPHQNELNTYAEVAATVQAFINDPDTILTLIANGQLEDSLNDLREMESVLIDVDQEKEELVPRPSATSETYNLSMDILERAEESLFDEYRGKVPSGLASALGDVEAEETVEVESDDEFDFTSGLDEAEWAFEDESSDADSNAGIDDEGEPEWFGEDDGVGSPADTEALEPVDGSADRSTGEPAAASTETDPADVSESGDTARADSPSWESDDTKPTSGETTGKADVPDDETLGGLFDDMDETLESMGDRRSDDDPNTGESDPMFPEENLTLSSIQSKTAKRHPPTSAANSTIRPLEILDGRRRINRRLSRIGSRINLQDASEFTVQRRRRRRCWRRRLSVRR